jgi:hypothetical protein
MSLKGDIHRSKGISGPLWQCFGSGTGSGLDQDSIRPVDPNPDSDSRSGSRKAKPHIKVKKFHVLKSVSFLLIAEDFSCSLNIHCGGVGISKLLFFIK